ncbi:MAG: 2-polyprenyl-6-hydroxyphenyl methylase3-demethylubiquinone-9 3-methyltransferase [Methyloprofundus sp.]|nr:MAG: 2-polyprenyl-6-hydroxyphenyl methylase3-demethylubiquinone-9 3-methyltransferase [Methyloprofundus sp.]
MLDEHINNPKSIKYYVNQYLQSIKTELVAKIIVDAPAGTGATSEILKNLGAEVRPFDLFPEYFMLKGVQCERANIADNIPLDDKTADMLICQEGIEHFSDQLKAFKEFNRVLKQGGRLLITTPSYSNLAAKLSYLLFESETNNNMPPNEIDDVWMSDKAISNEIYHGHIFLVGLQKLRIIAKLAGFKIHEIKYVRLSKGSLILLPFVYPFIVLNSLRTYYRNINKDKGLSKGHKLAVYQEQLLMNINPKHLINKHTFVIFEKEDELQALDFRNEKIVKGFDGRT